MKLETRSGSQLSNVSIRWCANNTRQNLTDAISRVIE